MSALANLLNDLGHSVLGVDKEEVFFTDNVLSKFKIESFDNYDLKEDNFYIIGNAYHKHLITKQIIRRKYDYKYYPDFIDSYFKNYQKISVAGTHGKTTTTKMISDLLEDTNAIIGDGTGHGDKDSKRIVFEACEYKNTFLNYHSSIGVILNIDYDHPDFFKSKDDYFKSFSEFASKCEMLVINGDDAWCNKLNVYNKVTFGTNPDNDIVFKYINNENSTTVFINEEEFVLPLCGLHFIYDFVASYAVSKICNVNSSLLKERIERFKLPRRRLETVKLNYQVVINDYAHHPSELEALYNSVSLLYPNYLKVIIFESHTNSRSIRFKHEFKRVLSKFDLTYVTNVFTSVREKESKKCNDDFINFLDFQKINEDYLSNLHSLKNSVIIFAGAGNIYNMFKNYTSNNPIK